MADKESSEVIPVVVESEQETTDDGKTLAPAVEPPEEATAAKIPAPPGLTVPKAVAPQPVPNGADLKHPALYFNQEYEVTLSDSATIPSIAETNDHNPSTIPSIVAATTESIVAATIPSIETKGKEKETPKEKKDPSLVPGFWSPWPQVLQAIECTMPKPTFQDHLLGASAIREDGRLIITVRRPYSVPWLDKQLRRQMERAVARYTDEPLALEFRARDETD